jgi:hypothetical protein
MASFFGRRQSNNQSQEYFTTCLAMSELSLLTGTRNPLPRQRLCLLFFAVLTRADEFGTALFP